MEQWAASSYSVVLDARLGKQPPPQSEWLAHLTAGIKDTLFSRRDSPGERKPPSTRAGARRTGRLCCLNKSVLMSHHIQEILMRDPDGSVYI